MRLPEKMFSFRMFFNGKINLSFINQNTKASKHNFHSWSCSLRMFLMGKSFSVIHKSTYEKLANT